jgi:hypothetical protein
MDMFFTAALVLASVVITWMLARTAVKVYKGQS